MKRLFLLCVEVAATLVVRVLLLQVGATRGCQVRTGSNERSVPVAARDLTAGTVISHADITIVVVEAKELSPFQPASLKSATLHRFEL
jgi:flagella basal body P-ring formation protein FlgA